MNKISLIAMALIMGSSAPSFAAVGNDKSASYVREAEDYLKKGNVKAAIIQLKNAIVAEPKNPEYRVSLADLYLREKNAASAEKEYLRALDLGIDRSKVIVNLSKTYLLQRQFRKVLDTLKEENAVGESKGEVYLIIGNAHQGSNDLDKALEYFEKGEQAIGKNDELGIAIAQIYYFQKKMDKAEEKVDDALSLNPKNAKGIILKGELVNLKSGPKESLPFFMQALEYEPKNISALFKTAAVLFDLQRSDEALEKLDVIYTMAPKHPLANYLSAVIYVRKNNLDKAEEFLNASGQAFDNFPGALILRGMISYSRQNYAQAIYNLNKMVKVAPNNIVARRLLGASLLRQDDAEQAVKALMPIVESGRAGSVTFALLGSANMKLGNFEKGTEFFEKAVESKPGESKLKTQLALSKLASGNSEAAQENLQEILEKDPNSKQAAVFMTLISLREKNFEEALTGADRLIAQSAENPVGYNLKGTAFIGMKKTNEAREQFLKALDVAPEYHSASLNLAGLEARSGNIDKAKEIYQGILKSDKEYTSALMALARLAKGQNESATAEDYYQKAVDSAEKDIRPAIEFSEFFVGQKKYERAKAIVQKVILDFPDHAAGYEASGNIDLMMGDTDSAVGNFERMAAMLGNNASAYQLLGRAQLRNNDVQTARKTFQKALSLANNKVPLYIELIGLESSKQNFGKSQEYIDILKKTKGQEAVAFTLEGRLLAAEAKHKASLASYLKAAEMGAKGSRFVVDISRAYFNNDNKEKALETINSWLENNRNDLAVRHILAGYYLQESEYQKSIEQYEIILNLYKGNPVALNNIAWLYSQVGQNAKALSTAEKAYNLFPEEASFIDTYAWILVQQGQNDKGLELLQKAVSKAPRMMEVRYHFAVALNNAGRKAIARKELETVVSSGETFSGIEDARSLLNKLSQ